MFDKNKKFTLEFSDEEFVQEVDFLLKNEYYITSLNCKLKVKGYIHDKDEKIKKFSEKSRLLLEKGPSYQTDLYYLLLETIWYVKRANHSYQFKFYPQIINHDSYKYKFWMQRKKKIEIFKIILHFLNLLEKDSFSKENL